MTATATATRGAAAPGGAPAGAMAPGRARQLLTAALMIATATVAFETQVVTVALPSITGELQGIALYPWVFSGYLLMSTITAPIYGKGADIFGRRPLFMLGFTIFSVGTFLCGAATSMPFLVASRVVQGLGAGAILPLVLTVTGDIYTIRERPRIQGLSASIWGFFSFAGPSAGAFITEAVSWRWVFWSNLPLCLLAVALLAAFLKEGVARRNVSIDYAGAGTLTVGVVGILVISLEGGRSLEWGGGPMLALLAVSAIALVLFAVAERRAPEPILPFDAFRIRAVAIGNVGNVLIGSAQFLLSSFIPLLVQGVRGEGAASTGLLLTAQGSAWSLAAMFGGRFYVALGFRRASMVGSAVIASGIAGSTLAASLDAPMWVIAATMAFTGLGLGTCSTAFLYAPQVSVPWNRRGAVTSSTQFARNMAGAVFVALGGGWLNARLFAAATASGIPADEAAPLISRLISVSERASIDPAMAQRLGNTLGPGLLAILTGLSALAVATFVMMAIFARDVVPVEAAPVHVAPAD
ncbi:MAG: MFS transporter [Chloroflexi bacterium]|nr:MFS transporter [Chloroflexota bacterium]